MWTVEWLVQGALVMLEKRDERWWLSGRRTGKWKLQHAEAKTSSRWNCVVSYRLDFYVLRQTIQCATNMPDWKCIFAEWKWQKKSSKASRIQLCEKQQNHQGRVNGAENPVNSSSIFVLCSVSCSCIFPSHSTLIGLESHEVGSELNLSLSVLLNKHVYSVSTRVTMTTMMTMIILCRRNDEKSHIKGKQRVNMCIQCPGA